MFTWTQFCFLFRNNVLYRDVTINVFDWDEPTGDNHVDDHIVSSFPFGYKKTLQLVISCSFIFFQKKKPHEREFTSFLQVLISSLTIFGFLRYFKAIFFIIPIVHYDTKFVFWQSSLSNMLMCLLEWKSLLNNIAVSNQHFPRCWCKYQNWDPPKKENTIFSPWEIIYSFLVLSYSNVA